MLSSPKAGVALYLLQLFVSLVCGIILGLFAPRKRELSVTRSRGKKGFSFSKTVQGAVLQSLFISGYVLFFSAILSVTLPYLTHPFVARLSASLLEISNACSLSASAGGLVLPFCAFSACFSGLSVYFQTLDCIDGMGLDTKRYLPVKLLCGAAGFFLALFLPSFR